MRNKMEKIINAAKKKAAMVLTKKNVGIDPVMVFAIVCVVMVAILVMLRAKTGVPIVP